VERDRDTGDGVNDEEESTTTVGEVRDLGDVIEIPIVEEEVEVIKRPVVKEVLRIRKRRVTEEHTVEADVREEHLVVKETPDNGRPENDADRD